MTIAITAIGTAVPAFKRSQMEVAELICEALQLKPAEKRMLKAIYKATGIETRHSVLSDYCKQPGDFNFFPNNPTAIFPSTSARMNVYKQNALNLALQAIQDCLTSASDQSLNNITHLITVSCTGMYAPGIDIEIVKQLNLNPRTKRTCINFMGCYGAFNGLKVADAICKADSSAKVLLVCVELCSIHFQKEFKTDNLISNAIFADGSAAVILETKPDNKKCLSIESFYSDLISQTDKEMTWHIGDFGFDIELSSYVPEIIQSGILEFAHHLLQQSNFSRDDIDFYAIHPGGIKILQACEEALAMTPEDNRFSYEILKHYGNMSSATVLFVLKRIWDYVTNTDHQKNIFSCAFGPGLTLESMILKTHSAN